MVAIVVFVVTFVLLFCLAVYLHYRDIDFEDSETIE